MNKIKTVLEVLAVALVSMLVSCASSPEKKIDSVYLMVYDYDNSEVMNVSVYVDGEVVGETDIYGRLMIPCDKQKEVIVRAEKKGYETIETKEAIKPGILLYFKMGSGSYYAEKAERFLDEKHPDDALRLINKALEIEERKDWAFLKEVIERRIGNVE